MRRQRAYDMLGTDERPAQAATTVMTRVEMVVEMPLSEQGLGRANRLPLLEHRQRAYEMLGTTNVQRRQ